MNLTAPVFFNAVPYLKRTCSLLLIMVLVGGSTLLPANAATPPAKKPKSAATKNASDKKDEKSTVTPTPAETVPETFIDVTPEELVDKPQDYLNKNVKFTGKFFAFSSLALDYKPALRSSKTYLSFLILRSQSHVPLSELKLALLIPKEKDPENALISVLKDGDTIELSGKEFSTALGEPWVDVHHIKKIGGSSDDKTAEAGQESKDKDSDFKAQEKPEAGHEQSKP
jgi:hypothetical protein